MSAVSVRPPPSTCGCCAGLGASTPALVQNRPGLSAIAYRSGTWHEFKRSLLAALAGSRHPQLAGLATRDDDDFSIALLDGVAAVADVLTFYQERIANEAYLRTATERLSILELARLIGYELKPGVAAGTLLAFTVEDAEGAPGVATIDVGVKVQSIPGHEEKPQTFETIEKLEARAEWSAMRPRRTAPPVLAIPAEVLWLAGTATDLKPGDWLLLVGGGRWEACRVSGVKAFFDPDPDRARTRVAVASMANGTSTVLEAAPAGIAAAAGGGSPGPSGTPSDFEVKAGATPWGVTPTVCALRVRAALFAHNAADWMAMSTEFKTSYLGKAPTATDIEWPDFQFLYGVGPGTSAATIDLDAVYPSILPGDRLLMVDSDGDVAPYLVTKASTLSRAQYGVSAKITRAALSGSGFSAFTNRRNITVYAGAQSLDLADAPLPAAVAAGQSFLYLDRDVGEIPAGRTLLVAGIDPVSGEAITEAATLDHVEQAGAVSRLVFTAPLRQAYRRDSLAIHGNVAAATHGETVKEVLGAGDSARRYQRFALRQPPLTYVRDEESASGAASTLALRVNDLLWQEVPTFYGRGPAERVYVTRHTDEGTTIVQFGDGAHGARVPSGAENVGAAYRKGTGIAGNVKAGQLSNLLTRPLGLKAAVNPQPASGGDDPEPRDGARQNAPLTVLTLERVVSLRDYEDFARAYAGIAKALATWSWDGERRGVFITVAGPNGAPIATDVLELLLGAIRDHGDPFVPLRVETYREAKFTTTFKLKVAPAYETARVETAVVAALRAAFGFAARAFGQPVALSDVFAAIQGLAGVTAVDVDSLVRTDGVGGNGLKEPLPAALPELDSLAGTQAAELLILADAPIVPGAMT